MAQTAQSLPARPNLDFLKKLAKKRVRSARGEGGALKLADAQLALARELGFASWRKLKAHVELAAEAAMAHPRAAKNSQWKPIMDAAFLGDADAVRKLLKAGADPNVLSATGHRYRPLHRAIEPKKTRQRGSAHEEVVKALLEGGADPNLRGTFSNVTALQLAATGEFRFVRLLRRYVEPLDIFHAAACGDDARVAELLKHDKPLALAKDVNDMSPLHYCCASSAHKHGKSQSAALVRIATMLIDAGADPNAAHMHREWPIPPLYHALGQQNNVAVGEVLLKAGASPYDGESVYHSADEGHQESLALLEKYTKTKPLALECSKAMANMMHWNRSRAVPWLLAHGADPNYLSTHYGNSALHEAVKRGASDQIITMMLEHGGDPKLKNKEGKSALDLAKGKPRVLRAFEWRPAMIDHSTAVLAVADVTRTAAFYVDVLGFHQRWLWGEPPTFGCIGLGKAELFLCQNPELAAKIEGHQHCFFADNVEALHGQHRKSGASVISPLENKPWGVREYTVRDINGYHLRFTGPQKYERPPTARESMPSSVRIAVELPTIEQYVSLLTSVNWAIDHEMAAEVLRRTTICVLARDGGEAVGIARATGDGRNFTIWDVVVRPSHQGQRIGSALMEAIVSEIRRTAPHVKFVGLFTGKPEFYERLGFKKDGGMHQAM